MEHFKNGSGVTKIPESKGVRYLILEQGFLVCQYLNQYLETGNETMLNNLMEIMYGKESCLSEDTQVFRDIYEYNMTLPEE